MDIKRWYIFENQKRVDGDVNFIKTEKYSLASALSYYYTKLGAYCVDTTYPEVSISLQDVDFNVIRGEVVQTEYKAEE